MLLLNEVESLCRTCHGTGTTGSVLNVFDGTNDADGGGLRSGGFENARIRTDDPSLPTPGATPATTLTIGVLDAPGEITRSSHSVDGSPQTIWGNGAITGASNPGMAGYDLECGSCHDPHGNGNYRILRSIPSGSAAPTPGYAIPDTYPKSQASYSTSNYFNMTFTGSASSDNILKDTSAWCSQCHTRYLASRRAPTGPADQSRVDSGDPIFKFRHTSSGVSYSSTTGAASNVTRACITCHAAHGSNATAGDYSGSVPLPGVTPAAPPPAGTNTADSRLLKMNTRGMCQKCHNL
jgi:cytochrome c553